MGKFIATLLREAARTIESAQGVPLTRVRGYFPYRWKRSKACFRDNITASLRILIDDEEVRYSEWKENTKDKSYEAATRYLTIAGAVLGSLAAMNVVAKSEDSTGDDGFHSFIMGGLFGALCGRFLHVAIPLFALNVVAGKTWKRMKARHARKRKHD